MLVTDAGTWVRALFDEDPGGSVRARLRREPYVDAPALMDQEFLSAARGLLARGLVTRGAAEAPIETVLRAPIDRHGHGPLAWRAGELRANLTPYDASDAVLAELLAVAL